MFSRISLFIIGTAGISYSLLLHILNPSPFIDAVFSFFNIWALSGTVLIFFSFNRPKQRIRIPLWFISLLCIGITATLFNLYLIIFPLPQPVSETTEYLMLLGGGITKDGELVIPVQNRVAAAASYLSSHPETKCIVTGGTLDHLKYAESPAIKRALIEAGIEEHRIFEENEALDTIQNIEYSAAIMCRNENKSFDETLQMPVALVTSRFHLNRALFIARRSGFTKVYGIPANTPAFYVPHDYLREICAWLKLELRLLITGRPALIQQPQ